MSSKYEKLKIVYKDDPEMLKEIRHRETLDKLDEKSAQEIKAEYIKGEKGDEGKEGYSPIKGVDYFDGYTPVKGVDYFDGEKGDDGNDGKDADEDKILKRLLKYVPTSQEIIKDIKLPTPAKEINRIELLQDIFKSIPKIPTLEEFLYEIKSKKLLELKDIKGARLDRQSNGRFDMNDQRWHGGGISNITGLIEAGTNITITGSGTASDPYVINSSGSGGGSPGGNQYDVQLNDGMGGFAGSDNLNFQGGYLTINGDSGYGQLQWLNTPASSGYGGAGINGTATPIIVGALNGDLSIWSSQAMNFSADTGNTKMLSINQDNTITIPYLGGGGTQMVVADNTGILSVQTIPNAMVIGNAVVGGDPNDVLYIDGSGNLAQNDSFTFIGGILTITEIIYISAVGTPGGIFFADQTDNGAIIQNPGLIWDNVANQLNLGTSGIFAKLDTSPITSTDKTFTFPNASGTFALMGVLNPTNDFLIDGNIGDSGNRVTTGYFTDLNVGSAGTLTFVTAGSKNITINQGRINFNDLSDGSAIGLVGHSTSGTNQTITLPDATGTVALTSDIPMPGGSDTQIQFNNSGSFGGNAAFTFINSDNILKSGIGFFDPTLITDTLAYLGNNIFYIGAGSTDDSNFGAQMMLQSGEDQSSPSIYSFSSGATTEAPEDVTINSTLLGFYSYGYVNGGFSLASYFDLEVENVNTTNIASRVRFSTIDISGTQHFFLFNSNGSFKIPQLGGGGTQMVTADNNGLLAVQAIPSGGTPAGSDTYIQYNDSGSFGGDANFTWDKSAKTFELINGSDFIKIQPDIGSGQPGIEFFNQGIVSSKIFANNSSQLEINSDLKVDGAITTTSFFTAPGLTSGGFSSEAGSLTLGALSGHSSYINFSEQSVSVWANLGVVHTTGDLIYETQPSGTTNFGTGTEVFRIAQSNGLVTVKYRLSGGTGATMNLNGLLNNGIDFNYTNGGIFRAAEIGVYGTNDVFFQGISAAGTSGFVILESWSSGGLILGTGNNSNPVMIAVNRTEVARFTASGLNLTGIVTNYKGVATTGYGVPAIYKSSRATAQTAAASLSAFTVGAADGSFLISANVLVTAATLHNFTVTCTYTDESNTSRTLTLPFSTLAGAIITAIVNAGGAVAYEGVPLHIRAKAGTTITIASVGTFTTVTYNIEEMISQIA